MRAQMDRTSSSMEHTTVLVGGERNFVLEVAAGRCFPGLSSVFSFQQQLFYCIRKAWHRRITTKKERRRHAARTVHGGFFPGTCRLISNALKDDFKLS